MLRSLRTNLELWLTAVGVLAVVLITVSLGTDVLSSWQIAAVTSVTVGLIHGVLFWVLRQRRRAARRALVEQMQQVLAQQISAHLEVLNGYTLTAREQGEIAAAQQSAAMVMTLAQALLNDDNPSRTFTRLARLVVRPERGYRWTGKGAPPQPGTPFAPTPVEAMLESHRDPAFICDSNGTLQRVNHAFVTHFGLTTPPRIGAPLVEVLPEPLAAVCLTHIRQLTLANPTAVGRATLDRRWYSYTLNGVIAGGPVPVSVVVTLRDLTGDVLQRAREEFLAATSTPAAVGDADELLRDMADLAVQGFAEWCTVIRCRRPGVWERVALTCADPARRELLAQLQTYMLPHDAPVGFPWVIRTGQTEFWPQVPPDYIDMLTPHQAHRDVMYAMGIASVLAVPLMDGTQTLGSVTFLRWTTAHAYTDADRHAAEAWARQASRAVDHADLYRRARRYHQELQTAQQLARRMVVPADMASLIKQTVTDLNVAYGYKLVSVYLLIDDLLVLQSYVGYDTVLWELTLDQSVAGKVVRSGHPAFVRDLTDDPKFVVVQPGTQQGIIVPLTRRDGAIFGVLLIESTGDPELTTDDLSLLQLLADHISVAADAALMAEQLAAAEQTLAAERGLFTQGPVVVFRWGSSPGWPIEYVSANIAQFGFDAQEVMRARTLYTSMIAPDDRLRVREELYGYQRAAVESFEQRYQLQQPDGTLSWVNDVTVVRRNAAGEITHYDGYLLDITEQMLAEATRQSLERRLAAAQKLESLGLLAAGVAHDFNNLLAVIVGNVSMLQLDVPADSPLRPYVAHIKLAARRATDLTQQILTYAGKSRLNARPLDLNEIVAEVSELMESTLAPNIGLRTTLTADLPLITGDATQLHQIVTNLVVNAADALGADGGQIRLSTIARALTRHPELASGRYVALTVSDTGCGMDAATQARMFDPFFSTKPKGRGLGLATVLGTVRMHGGTIEVSSALQSGTSITILIPAEQADPTRAQRAAASEGQVTAWVSANPAAVALVIDDEDAVRDAVAVLLERIGLRTVLANGGDAGLALAHTHAEHLGLAVIDVTMPHDNGLEVRQRLRAAFPTLPLLVMSGYSQIDVPSSIGDDPLTRFLPKPFTLTELQAVLGELHAARTM